MKTCCGAEEHVLYSKAAKEKILEEIIDMEEKMFVEVNKQGEKADCQSQLKAFRSMRHMSFAVLSGETLKSYWEDLHFAIEEGRNLVVEKYARMDNLIPVISEHSAIAKIVDIESTWMQELQKEYPHILHYDDNFARYASAELETYSDQTRDLYYRDVLTAKQLNINLVRERYLILYKGMGFKSLEEVEARAIAKQKA